MLNNHSAIRRKWAFEKGRNSFSVLFAAAVTAAVTLAAFFALDYGISTPDNWRQTTAFAFIHQDDREAMQLIREFDPSNTYRLNNGGYPFCTRCRRSHEGLCEYDDNFIRTVESFAPLKQRDLDPGKHEIPAEKFEKYSLPPSGIFAPVLPHVPVTLPQLRIVDQQGKTVEYGKEKFLEINQQMDKPAITSLRISGTGLLAHIEIISSCGSRRHDPPTRAT